MKKKTKPGSSNGHGHADIDLKDFFSATEAREDRWHQLHTVARALSTQGNEPELSHRVMQLMSEIESLETYWAYPGRASASKA